VPPKTKGELRSLHLVDLDSLAGGVDLEDYGRRSTDAIQRYRNIGSIQPSDDAIVVGLDAELFDASGGDRGSLIVLRRLPSGEVLTFCDCAVLYDQVVVASDSTDFAPVVEQLARHGTHVVVVSSFRRPHRALTAAATEVVTIPRSGSR
jgi:NYN domain